MYKDIDTFIMATAMIKVSQNSIEIGKIMIMIIVLIKISNGNIIIVTTKDCIRIMMIITIMIII